MHKKRFHFIGIAILLIIIGAVLVVGVYIGTSHPIKQSPDAPKPQQPDVTAAALACIEKLPNDVKIGQKLMVAGYSAQLEAETPILVSTKLDGIIMMDQADKSAISTYASGASINPTIAVDQEGGTVQRYAAEGELPGATDMAAGFTPQQAYNQYVKDDQYLQSVGITTNFAPLVDVMSANPSPLPGRMYSSDPSTVINYASQAITASQVAGITPVIKHFPGLGSSTGNTDFGTATTDPLQTLKTRDLIPYQQLKNLKPDVMVANAIVPGLTNGQPATWSPEALSLLRSYGYQDAVTYSDSLTAQAIPGSLEDAVIKAWQAGIDVALIVQTSDQTPALQGYIQQIIDRANAAIVSGELNAKTMNQSIARILSRKGVNPCDITQ